MSVPNPKVNKSNTQNNFLPQNQSNDDDQWQDANGSEIAYLIKPNEVVTFTPLNNVKPVKGGHHHYFGFAVKNCFAYYSCLP